MPEEKQTEKWKPHLEDAVVDGEEGNIECSASQVEHEDVLLSLLVEAVGDGGGGGLVDDALHRHSRDSSGVLQY